MNTLEKINSLKRKEVEENKLLYPIKLLERSGFFNTKTVSLEKYLKREDKNGIIAEIKKQSPSAGIINQYVNIEKTSIGYMQAGSSALSILTDKSFFGGKNEDLITARKFNFCPILRKDFIVDEYQIIESKSIGSDAILLIASSLSKTEIKSFTDLAFSLGLEVLFEVHSEEELDKIPANAKIIGVNNRDLRSMRINLETSYSLIHKLPRNVTKVTESGIENPNDIIQLKSSGYSGFLIGSYFMKHTEPSVACKELASVLRSMSSKNKISHAY